MKRKYLNFDPSKGYILGPNIFYECLRCGDVLPSQPEDGLGCSCRNIFIDVDAGRISVKDDSLLKIFEKD